MIRLCPYCGKIPQICECDDEDWEDDGETIEDEIWSESYDEQQFEKNLKK